jgi:hypothetical protein
MRLNLPFVVSAAVCSAVSVSGFAPSSSLGFAGATLHSSSSVSFLSMTTEPNAPCDIPTDVVNPDLVSQKGSGKLLRSAMLTDADGELISLGSKMGQGTSVVVFLRHMG